MGTEGPGVPEDDEAGPCSVPLPGKAAGWTAGNASWLDLERALFVVFVFLGLLFLIEGALVWRTAHSYLEAISRARQYESLRSTLGDFLLSLDDAETGQRGYLLTGKSSYLAPYTKGTLQSRILGNRLVRLSGKDSGLLRSLKPLLRLAELKREELSRTIRLADGGRRDAALSMLESGLGKKLMDEIRIDGSQVEQKEADRLAGVRSLSVRRANQTGRNLLASGILLVLIFSLFYYLVYRSVRERKHLLVMLEKEAVHDFLTKLPNRKYIMDALSHLLPRNLRRKRLVAVLFIDLDGFKTINDRFGHAIGDKVLVEVARRFTAVVRSEDILARLGGDEFLVCMPEISEAKDASALASRLISSLSSPPLPESPSTTISCSIGISVSPEDGETPQEMIKTADKTMYLAKKEGKGRFLFAGDSLKEKVS